LLHNNSKNGTVIFTDVTDVICKSLRLPGMVTAACFADINDDTYPDLLIAGDWMPVMLFINNNGKFIDVSDRLPKLNGMWASVTAADVDNDGKTDFILGNSGYNNQLKVSDKAPLTMNASDFDNDGIIDPLICSYIQGVSYPIYSRDELLNAIPSLRKKFIRYSDYADARISDIFSKDKIKQALVYTCNNLASGILYNNGNNDFEFQPFPPEAQFSKVFGSIADDFDKDGIKDILIAGNYYVYKTELGQNDAGLGLLLKGTVNRKLQPMYPTESNCYIDGDVRAMVEIKNKNGSLIIVAKNGAAVQVLAK
jgi:hypothetical protein